MAAKQGFSAQFSQASEDAKRAVLSRTKSPWLHSMNTTCTIKSAPPRSPEVLELLSTKSGWLWKRNEQHVWQSRWCCVVPHMFLYYFDIEMDSNTTGGSTLDGNSGTFVMPAKPTDEQQDAWNRAVKYGYGNRPQKEPRGSLYPLFQGGGGNHAGASANTDPSTPTGTTTTPSAATLASATPAGIIDLECYTAVNRSSENQLILELAGDSDMDPDLRSFYFCASTLPDGDEWTQAFLHERHSQLLDEREAYKQVCEGFALQLQELHARLDDSTKSTEEANEECYRVRSGMEETRRMGWRILRDVLERDVVETATPIHTARQQYRVELERTPHHELIPALHVWGEYTKAVEDACVSMFQEKQALADQLVEGQDVSVSKLQQVQQELVENQSEWNREKAAYEQQIQTLQSTLQQTQTQLENTRQDLSTQRMEMTMYQTSSRTKVTELTNHKKILKKEVIELRKTLEDLGSELSLLKHTTHTSRSEIEQERRKTELLERYVAKMERQVRVQQNMMELMSHNGGAGMSRMGDEEDEDEEEFPHKDYIRGPNYTYESEHTSPRNNHENGGGYGRRRMNNTKGVQEGEDELSRHEQLLRRSKQAMVMVETRPPAEDEKSHVSELTEDRTQRNLESMHYDESPMRLKPSQRTRHPPSYILGSAIEETVTPEGLEEHRNTISGPKSLPPPRRRRSSERRPSSGSIESTGSTSHGRSLSVAQRARIEADQGGGNVIRIRANSPLLTRGGESPLRPSRNNTPSRHRHSSDRSQTSFLSNLGRSLSDALIVPEPETSSEDSDFRSCTDEDRSTGPEEGRTRELRDEDFRPSSPGVSDANVSHTESMPLRERRRTQRAQQLRFLKEQGLIKDESSLRGGAGAPSPRPKSETGSLISLGESAARIISQHAGARSEVD